MPCQMFLMTVTLPRNRFDSGHVIGHSNYYIRDRQDYVYIKGQYNNKALFET